jgi:methyltransferase (TIGR00027 family)
LRLCGFENEVALQSANAAAMAQLGERYGLDLAQSFFRAARSGTVLRSRYVEDELDQAIQRGVSQYVILGAGLDSFAYRKRHLVDVLRIFEVDHPATQTWKRERLKAVGVDLPTNLTFVPLDFEKQSLIETLQTKGYRTDAPALFSWLGVVPYLTEEAIFGTLRTVASVFAGTEIIFDYAVPAALLGEEERQLLSAITAFAAARGEPFLSLMEPTRLVAQVRELGFASVWDLGPEEVNSRYCADRTDGLRLSLGHFMRAVAGRSPT